MKRLIAGALIAGTAVFGLTVGAGDSDAKIKPGNYKQQQLIYGFVPMPESNARVIGNGMYTDYYGIGPWNLQRQQIQQTPHGGVVAHTADPVMQWFPRTEFRRTKNGYVGTMYSWGVPLGSALLKEQPRR
ncbi:hypothetical protein [Gordonia sp. UCD-TK1]|uniref:hypothetical protein n=1 Tax=Gordonia sp. UCD-TK1 TaxID=1857893 RepID=UPI00080DD9BA|nr:hypothetical protein [Gordonia sp. UCD-TK1]OCH83154.1 hypothetical protein A9310_02720 [Gordonia sp. UCD-TK1]